MDIQKFQDGRTVLTQRVERATQAEGKAFDELMHFYQNTVDQLVAEVAKLQTVIAGYEMQRLARPEHAIWRLAPDWAKFCAVDESGAVHFHSERPRVSIDVWYSPGAIARAQKDGLPMTVSLSQQLWKYSLLERPKAPAAPEFVVKAGIDAISDAQPAPD